MPRDLLCDLLYATLTLAALIAQGCGKSSSQQPMAKAEALVEKFLDAWSRGESPDKFANPDWPLHVTDPDWKAGYRLLSFLSIEAKPSQELPDHVRCRVALSLRDRKGKNVDKEVVYDVRMGEKSIISRVSR